MTHSLLTVEIRQEQDVVLARQRARQIARVLGFDNQDQIRIATAVSEIARNAFQYAGQGRVEFQLGISSTPQTLEVRCTDRGPGIANLQSVLDGHRATPGGVGLGLAGVRRLMDDFQIQSSVGRGTTVLCGKVLPKKATPLTTQIYATLAEELARTSRQNPFEELRLQNQELLAAYSELGRRQKELEQLNRELAETNRGVVALYAELDEKAASLQRVSEMKSRFLSNMSHEFRTPLNSILGLSRMLLDRVDGPLTADQEKQMLFIQKAASDLSEVVNDLLDLAKVEAGKIDVRPDEFTAASLFGALRGTLRPLAADNPAVTLHFEDCDGLRPLFSDEGKISQILRNFISNGLKYTERGEIRVAAMPGAHDTMRFMVTDTGIGIAPEDQERIFEDFVQVEGPHQKRAKGTGLGLPLARKLAELLGGIVSVRSQLGVGSTFTLVIPRVYRGPAAAIAAAPQGMRRPPRESLGAGRAGPILIIDDDEVARYALKGALGEAELPVVEATGGEQGLCLALERAPRCIFLDLCMPDLTGFEVLSRLKATATTRDVPVIIYTSRLLSAAERARLDSRVVAILPKDLLARDAFRAEVGELLRAAGLESGGAAGREAP